jgi:hypothetical protein
MAFYAAAADKNGTAVLAIVEPYTRYQFEYRLPASFDFNKPMKKLTVGSGLAVPAVRTSASGQIKPASWEQYKDYSVLDFYKSPYVLTGKGVFAGLDGNSSIREYLERAGIVFTDGRPQETPVKYGFTGIGGWSGNYDAVRSYLIGKNALKQKTLIDWTIPKYKAGINKDNFFGVDTVAGATKTVQNSYDGIAGATVRMSREDTSYQRAIAAAGILTEAEVIKGRF